MLRASNIGDSAGTDAQCWGEEEAGEEATHTEGGYVLRESGTNGEQYRN
jgi:hypothetical protein